MPMDVVKLINAVRNIECLWNVTTQEYKDRNRRMKAWKTVSKQVGAEPEDCSNRWKSLRDRFVRETKKIKISKLGDSDQPYKSSWPHFATMEFISDYINHRQTFGNITYFNCPSNEVILGSNSDLEDDYNSKVNEDKGVMEDEVVFFDTRTCSISPSDETYDENTQSQNSPKQPLSKRRRVSKSEDMDDTDIGMEGTVRTSARIELDEDEIFGKQVASIMRQISAASKSIARIQILQTLHEIQFPSKNSNSKLKNNSFKSQF